MKSKIAALRTLIESVKTADEVEGLKAFVAAKVIAEMADEELEDEDIAGRAYASEKLFEAIDCLRQATMPDGSPLSLAELVAEAGFKISQFEENVPIEKLG